MTTRVVLALALALLPAPIRQEAPQLALSLRDLRGRTVKLESFKGKVVLLNFWATWCPPCRAEMPDLVALQQQYADAGLQVVGVTCPPYKGAEVARFVKGAKVTYPILFGTKGLAARVTGTDVLPVTLVLDRDGNTRATIEGILSPEEISEKVLPLLGPHGSLRPYAARAT